MKRLKGAKLSLKLGSPATEFAVELTNWEVTNEEKDADVTTFGDVAEGDDRDFFLAAEAALSTDEDSLWSYIWDHAGEEGVAYTIAPHGNAAITADEPHLIGTLTIGPKPKIGAEAGKDNTSKFDFSWKLDGEPTLDRTP